MTFWKASALLSALVLACGGCGGQTESADQPLATLTPSPLSLTDREPTTVDDVATVIGCDLDSAADTTQPGDFPCRNSHDLVIHASTGDQQDLTSQAPPQSQYFVVTDIGSLLWVSGTDASEISTARNALQIAEEQVVTTD